MNITDFSRIAIIQTAFLGDVALTLPLADAIRQAHPAAEIHFITTPSAASIAECSPSVNYVHKFDKRNIHKTIAGSRAFAQDLRNAGIDCIIAPHRSLRTTLLTSFIKPRFSVGFTKNALSWLYSRRVKYPIHCHEVERNLRLLSVFSETGELWLNKAPRPAITIPEEDALDVLKLKAEIFPTPPSTIIAIAPGSVWATKRWNEEYFINAATILKNKGMACVFIGGKEDERLCARLARVSGTTSIAARTSLIQTIEFLRHCAAIITNDSAPTHLAWIAGCPTTSIFGPTSPIFGFAPRGEYDHCIENTTLTCRPCAIHGGKQCPIGTHECMKSITPEMVTRSVQDILRAQQKA